MIDRGDHNGCPSPANVGALRPRAMEVHGDRLVIELDTNAWDGAPARRALTWERIG